MRTSHLKRTLLVFALQLVAMATAICLDHTSLQWLAFVGLFATYLVPFVGYIVALYDAPMFTDRSRVLKTAALTLLSIAATMGGTMIILLAFAVTRVPLRG